MTICLKSLFESNDQLTDTPAKLLVSLDFSRIIRMFFWFLFSQYSNLYDDDEWPDKRWRGGDGRRQGVSRTAPTPVHVLLFSSVFWLRVKNIVYEIITTITLHCYVLFIIIIIWE